jgi:hypothetical protein
MAGITQAGPLEQSEDMHHPPLLEIVSNVENLRTTLCMYINKRTHVVHQDQPKRLIALPSFR